MSRSIVGWQSPSNIAIVKYWGKHGLQLPQNASLSLTLSAAHTRTAIEYDTSRSLEIEYLYDGKPMARFADRIQKFLQMLSGKEMPWLRQMRLKIDSTNSFPHSSGIASSASFMSSLALCLCEIEGISEDEEFYSRASHIARLGSGSASRSVYGGAVIWGKHPQISDSSDEYAIPWRGIDAVFEGMHNDILILSAEEKSVSSSEGHRLMENHPFAQVRYRQAEEHLFELLNTMHDGDIWKFGEIMENEALTLHGLMMNSPKSFILMQPATLSCILRIRAFREQSRVPVFFTLDAGPNLHMIYPQQFREKVLAWRQKELDPLCIRVLEDRVGQGPEKIQ